MNNAPHYQTKSHQPKQLFLGINNSIRVPPTFGRIVEIEAESDPGEKTRDRHYWFRREGRSDEIAFSHNDHVTLKVTDAEGQIIRDEVLAVAGSRLRFEAA